METAMRTELKHRLLLGAAGLSLLALSLACSGGSSSTGTNTAPPPSGTVAASFSDASSEDWAQIGVRVMGITLTPQGGGTPVTIYTAPSTATEPAPLLNLVQLDQLSELIGTLQVPAGTYTSATLTISANPGDVTLVASSNPSATFPLAAGTVVDPSDIQIKHASGTAGSLTTTVSVTLVSPLVVTAGQTTNLDLEFNLAHPAFLVENTVGATTTWAVNFNGPVRHNPNYDLASTVLRHAYGSVTGVATDNTSISIVKEHEAYPVPASGPAPIASLQTLQILADATNGTLFYDLDADTTTTIKDFSAEAASLKGKYVRVASRYQADGTLVAVRVWASSNWASVWISPEGHVRHVDTTNNLLYVDNENGVETPIIVNANTSFFFRTPSNALADATPIGTGTAFLANLVRGFKVHVGADPLAANLTAKTVDIEIAKYEGTISGANATQFTYTRNFVGTADDYTMTLPYCSSTTKNGKDAKGNQILGFKWWNFTYPTLADTNLTSTSTPISDFVAAVGGSANFGGTFGAMKAWGMSYAVWGDPANPAGWSTKWAVLEPTLLPRGTVATPLVSSANGGTFGLSLPTGKNPVTVDVSTVSGSATLIYDVSVSSGVITVTPVDITTTAGQNLLATYLVSGTPVRVYGIPQADGSIKAYYINCFF
jgi:Domain of unknown function (DUF4382)